MERLKEFVTAINVEPAWLLYFVGIGMFYMPSQVPISQILNASLCINTKELYLEKACKVNLNHSSGICDNLANHTTIKIEIQKEVAGIQVVQNIVSERFFNGRWGYVPHTMWPTANT